MKNIYDILKDFGLEVPEDKKADFDKAWKENYRTKAEYEKATSQRDEYKTSLDTVNAKLMINNEPVSSNILRLIEEKGYKQCAIAKRAGYSKAVFSNIVNDHRVIRPSDVMRIAEALDVEPGELFQTSDFKRRKRGIQP